MSDTPCGDNPSGASHRRHSPALVSPAIASAAVERGARFIDIRREGFRARTRGLPQAEIVDNLELAGAFVDRRDPRRSLCSVVRSRVQDPLTLKQLLAAVSDAGGGAHE